MIRYIDNRYLPGTVLEINNYFWLVIPLSIGRIEKLSNLVLRCEKFWNAPNEPHKIGSK